VRPIDRGVRERSREVRVDRDVGHGRREVSDPDDATEHESVSRRGDVRCLDEDLQGRIAENSYLSNLLDSALSPGAVGAAVLTLGSVVVADLPSALALAGLSVPAMRGALEKHRETQELNRHRFYLLQEVESRTGA
jgi:hypothetical protein